MKNSFSLKYTEIIKFNLTRKHNNASYKPALSYALIIQYNGHNSQ